MTREKKPPRLHVLLDASDGTERLVSAHSPAEVLKWATRPLTARRATPVDAARILQAGGKIESVTEPENVPEIASEQPSLPERVAAKMDD